MFLPLALCSSDDDNNNTVPFEEVTIDLSGLNVELEDTSFTADGFNFTSFRAESFSGGNFNGVSIAFPLNDNPSIIELDLSSVNGISKIIISMFNNGAGSTLVSAINNGNIVQEITDDDIPSSLTDLEINVTGQTIDALRISSFEAIIISIKLE
jgi:hypothetical protein